MSAQRKPRKDGSPRKIRREARLLHLPERERKLVAGWLQSDGPAACLQRIATELHIACKTSTLYDAISFWDAEQRNDRVRAMALAQIDQEAEEKEMSPAEKLAALDRRMAEIKAAENDHAGYTNARYLIIADESAKLRGELEAAKLKIKERQVGQKDRDLELVERRVKLLEANAVKAKAELSRVATGGGLSPEALKEIERIAKIL